MSEHRIMHVVDDLGLHPATDRATFSAAGQGAITGADVMVNEPGASTAVETMKDYPWVSVGLHVTIFPGPARAEDGQKTLAFRQAPTKEGMDLLTTQTSTQIKTFQDLFGVNPPHISTHNHSHLKMDGTVFPQFVEAVHDVIGDDNETVIRGSDTYQIRHCRATTLQQGQPPLSPNAFKELLIALRDIKKPLELLIHPGLPLEEGEPELGEDYTLDMRVKDFNGLMEIFQSGVLTQAGYRLVSPQEFTAIKDLNLPQTMWPIEPTMLLSIPEVMRPSQGTLESLRYPWELLTHLQQSLDEHVVESRIAESAVIDPTARIEGPVWIGPEAQIGFNAHIIGPAVIGRNTKIRDHCLVSHSIIGDESSVGMSSEVTRSVVGYHYEVHSGKFIDSIGGDNIHLAGQAQTANQRVDRMPVIVTRDGESIATNLPKYGIAVGSYSTLGPNTLTYPGVSIGRESIVTTGTIVSEDVADLTVLESVQEQRRFARKRLLGVQSSEKTA